MFVVTISFTPVDNLQTTGTNSVRSLLYGSYYIRSLECFDVIVCLRYNKCWRYNTINGTAPIMFEISHWIGTYFVAYNTTSKRILTLTAFRQISAASVYKGMASSFLPFSSSARPCCRKKCAFSSSFWKRFYDKGFQSVPYRQGGPPRRLPRVQNFMGNSFRISRF